MARTRLEQVDERGVVETLDLEVGDRRKPTELGEHRCEVGNVGLGRAIGAEQDEACGVASARESMDEQQRVAVRPLDVVEHEQDRSVGRRAAHEVGDGFEEQAAARLGVLGFSEGQPAHSRRQVRRQAPDLTAVPRDMVGQH